MQRFVLAVLVLMLTASSPASAARVVSPIVVNDGFNLAWYAGSGACAVATGATPASSSVGYDGACFAVRPGESRVWLLISPFDRPTFGTVVFDNDATIANDWLTYEHFCGATSFVLPAGTQYVSVYLQPGDGACAGASVGFVRIVASFQ